MSIALFTKRVWDNNLRANVHRSSRLIGYDVVDLRRILDLSKSRDCCPFGKGAHERYLLSASPLVGVNNP